MAENVSARTVVVAHPNGLCMRGASAIAQAARGFQAKIEIVKAGQRVSTADPLEIVLLAAEHGTELVVEATGPDADDAVDAMGILFAGKFGLA